MTLWTPKKNWTKFMKEIEYQGDLWSPYGIGVACLPFTQSIQVQILIREIFLLNFLLFFCAFICDHQVCWMHTHSYQSWLFIISDKNKTRTKWIWKYKNVFVIGLLANLKVTYAWHKKKYQKVNQKNPPDQDLNPNWLVGSQACFPRT